MMDEMDKIVDEFQRDMNKILENFKSKLINTDNDKVVEKYNDHIKDIDKTNKQEGYEIMANFLKEKYNCASLCELDPDVMSSDILKYVAENSVSVSDAYDIDVDIESGEIKIKMPDVQPY